MDRILLITDDTGRSRGLARDLDGGPPCHVHDLHSDAIPVGPSSTIVIDLVDHGARAIERLSRLLAVSRQGEPRIVLLHDDSRHARILAVAVGAAETMGGPLDLPRLRQIVGARDPEAPSPAARAERAAEEVRHLFATMFVRDRPITPLIVDTGTEFIGRAIRDAGIRNWVLAVHQFDDALHQHCLLVAGLAAAFSRSLGLSRSDTHLLTKGALLHDVGKLRVPRAVLNKPGRLSPEERAIMDTHPAVGHAMLKEQGFAEDLLAVVRSHHEMLDGSGYPDGLAGDEIPDLVRLVTVCDIFAALIERRSYKAPMSGEAAYAILASMNGRLDAAIVGAFSPVAAACAPALSSAA